MERSLEIVTNNTPKRDSSSRDNPTSMPMATMDQENNSTDDSKSTLFKLHFYSPIFTFLLAFI